MAGFDELGECRDATDAAHRQPVRNHMKKLLALAFVLLAGPAFAQDAALNTPITRPNETKIRVKELNIRPEQVLVSLSVQDNAGAEIRYYTLGIPPSPESPVVGVITAQVPVVAVQTEIAASESPATVVGVITAIGTARAGETGSAPRRFNYRLLGYLVDQGLLTGVTLQP